MRSVESLHGGLTGTGGEARGGGQPGEGRSRTLGEGVSQNSEPVEKGPQPLPGEPPSVLPFVVTLPSRSHGAAAGLLQPGLPQTPTSRRQGRVPRTLCGE